MTPRRTRTALLLAVPLATLVAACGSNVVAEKAGAGGAASTGTTTTGTTTDTTSTGTTTTMTTTGLDYSACAAPGECVLADIGCCPPAASLRSTAWRP